MLFGVAGLALGGVVGWVASVTGFSRVDRSTTILVGVVGGLVGGYVLASLWALFDVVEVALLSLVGAGLAVLLLRLTHRAPARPWPRRGKR